MHLNNNNDNILKKTNSNNINNAFITPIATAKPNIKFIKNSQRTCNIKRFKKLKLRITNNNKNNNKNNSKTSSIKKSKLRMS